MAQPDAQPVGNSVGEMMRERSHIGSIIQVVLFCALVGQHAGAEQVTALFLGNSHTYFNDLPSLVRNLAESAGDTLVVDSSAPGGCTLAYPPNAHLYDVLSISLIETGGWDYVVLQEQSQIPVIPYIRDNYMYPGAVALDSIIHANTPCCHTTFFMTWGWENGGQHSFGGYTSPDFADYDEMQDSVRTSYMRIADSLSAPVAPAGVAWQNAIHDGFPLSLFNPDGYHPSLSGSYLAACVFYATFFQKSPSGLTFTGGLSEDHAYWLQAIADSTVLFHLSEWNIDSDMPYSSFEYDWFLARRYLDCSMALPDPIRPNRLLLDFGDGEDGKCPAALQRTVFGVDQCVPGARLQADVQFPALYRTRNQLGSGVRRSGKRRSRGISSRHFKLVPN